MLLPSNIIIYIFSFLDFYYLSYLGLLNTQHYKQLQINYLTFKKIYLISRYPKKIIDRFGGIDQLLTYHLTNKQFIKTNLNDTIEHSIVLGNKNSYTSFILVYQDKKKYQIIFGKTPTFLQPNPNWFLSAYPFSGIKILTDQTF